MLSVVAGLIIEVLYMLFSIYNAVYIVDRKLMNAQCTG